MTTTTAKHPATERLTAFSWGKLDDAEASEIAAHLDTCADCQKTVETLPDDALVSLVRKVVTRTSEQASTVTLVESWLPTELLAHPRYRLVRWLGAGGMGVVYQAEHRLMERPVAIKIISKKLTDSANTVARFKKEVKAAAKLCHPNIVTAYDAEQAGDLHFLVMEVVEGKSLARLVEDGGPLPVCLACEYVRQAALGLQHASEQGLVHRDIKPQNLMLTPNGQVKILDFGLAGFVSENGPVGSLTGFGGLGTPDYVAPEQIRNTHAADIRADIYSLGCTFYFLLTGQPPFPEGSASQKIAAHLERKPKAIFDLRRDLPVELAQIVGRTMEKAPDNRYQKPVEVAKALADLSDTIPQSSSIGQWILRSCLLGAGLVAAIIAVIFMLDLPGASSSFFDSPKCKLDSPTKEGKPASDKFDKEGLPVDSGRTTVSEVVSRSDADEVGDIAVSVIAETEVEKKVREAMIESVRKTPGQGVWVGSSENDLFAITTRQLPKAASGKKAVPLILSALQMKAFHELILHKAFMDRYAKEGLTDSEALRLALLKAYETQVVGEVKSTFFTAKARKDLGVAIVVAPERNVQAFLFAPKELNKVRYSYRDVKYEQLRSLMRNAEWKVALAQWQHLRDQSLVSPNLYLDAAICLKKVDQPEKALALLDEAFTLFQSQAASDWFERCGDQALEIGTKGESLAQRAYEKAAERILKQ